MTGRNGATLALQGADDNGVRTLVQGVRIMVGQNVLAEIQTAVAKSGARLGTLRHQIGSGFTVLGILNTVLIVLR